MTLDLERSAIETYFSTQWGSTTPIIFDAHGGTPVVNSVRLTIQSGATLQGSIGRMLNRIDHIGLATVTIYTEGGNGSAAWRGYAETLTDIFWEQKITTAGASITASEQTFVRFSPPELSDNRHPYIAASFADAPFHITNLIAPFVRYTYR